MSAQWIPPTTRPIISGSEYMVSAGHSAAAMAASRILEAGGNATDAGVAGGLCLNVVQPDLTSIGGVAPICLYQAKTKRATTISGLGPWPKMTDVDVFHEQFAGSIPPGIMRTVVPAAMEAWLTALRLYGTLSFAEVAAPAIELAAGGFPVHSVMYDTLADPAALSILRGWHSSAKIFLDEDGNPHPVGHLFIQSDLARTLKRLVEAEKSSLSREEGILAVRDEFYRGDIAEAMMQFSKQEGGWLAAADLAEFRVEIEEASTVNYRGYDVYSCGVWCQGPVVLQTLNILEGYDLSGSTRQRPDAYHLILESLKASFSDRDRYYGDPNFIQVPLDGLLSKEYAEDWRKRIKSSMATQGMPLPGDAWAYSALSESAPSEWAFPTPTVGGHDADTSYICVVDKWGNAFSATPSDAITGAPVVPGLGFAISARGAQSWLDPNHPSSIHAGKRPRLTPSPGLVIKDGEFVMPYGTPGLDMQPQAMVQFLVGMIDFGLDLQSAIEMPRVATFSFPSSSDPHTYTPGLAKLERRAGTHVAAELESRGHFLELWPDWTGLAGSISAIKADMNSHIYLGGADPRRVAYALGR